VFVGHAVNKIDELWQMIPRRRVVRRGRTNLGSWIEGALLYVNTQIGELRHRVSPCGAKILKGVKIVTLFSYIV